MTARVIVFGGTFDPVHNGHLAVAEQALAHCDAVQVWFVPAGTPPLRSPARAPLTARLAMLHAATTQRPELRVMDTESRRAGVSHTIETITQLHAEHPGVELCILLGADAARNIAEWPGHDQLLSRERFVVVNRSGAQPFVAADAAAAGYDPARTRLLNIESPPISASQVRRHVADGESLDGLVPAAVAALIAELGLYRGSPAMHNAGG
ncbi:MAG: nicotinate (nicotinamide) nucleotide adenylyltransferase [Chloroflexi bacterium]|nr:MAG: nicotinate (nicotinamide) nucleotide adenylyltransferase [Chloroflexota bacterium]